MASPIKWPLIESGPEFQALIGLLVRHMDPDALAFDAPGPDGAQDTISGDRLTVYQAKHTPSGPPGKIIQVALQELARIRALKASADSRWTGVRHWVLVTSARRGSKTQRDWDATVRPGFGEIDLTATLWASPDVEKRLLDYAPDLIRVFFERKPRAFKILAEAMADLERDPLHQLTLGFEAIGRYDVEQRFQSFLESDDRVLPLIGEGGMGKTRLLWHLGRRALGWDVYWANVATLFATESWFDGLVRQRPTLILVDEPSDLKLRDALPGLLEALLEQASGPHVNWKIVVTGRSHNVLLGDWLADRRRVRVAPQVQLSSLTQDAATELANRCLPGTLPRGADAEHLAERIAHGASGIPVWIAAWCWAHRPESGLDLGTSQDRFESIASGLVTASVQALAEHRGLSRDDVWSVVQSLALLQPVEWKRNGSHLEVLADIAPDRIHRVIRELENVRLVHDHGGELSLRPDPIRDWVLDDWLIVVDRTQPSRAADRLVERLLGLPDWAESAIRALADVQARTNVKLLEPLARAVQDAARETADAVTWSRLLRLAELMAPARADLLVDLARLLRLASGTGDDARDRLSSLSSTLVQCSQWAGDAAVRGGYVRELAAVVEQRLSGLPEKRLPWDEPLRTLASIAEDDRSWAFGDAALDEIRRRLGTPGTESPSDVDVKIATTLAEPLLHIRRRSHRVRPGYQIESTGYRILPGSSADRVRMRIREELWCRVEQPSTSADVRVALLKCLETSHREANEFSAVKEADGKARIEEVDDDLIRAHRLVTQDWMTFRERLAVRPLYSWHVHFERRRPAAKALANVIEDVLRAEPVVGPFVDLAFSDVDEERRLARERIVSSLLAAPERIVETLRQAAESFTDANWGSDVAARLANDAGEAALWPVASDLARRSQTEPAFHTMASVWLAQARLRSTNAVAELLGRLVGACQDSSAVRRLLFAAYGPFRLPRDVALAADEAVDVLARIEAATLESPADANAFKLMGNLLPTSPTEAAALIHRLLERAPLREIDACFAGLLDGIRAALHVAPPSPSVHERVASIVVELLDRVPDLDRYDEHNIYKIDRAIQPVVGRLPASWLVELVERRRRRLGVHEPASSEQYLEQLRAGLRTHVVSGPGLLASLVDVATIDESLESLLRMFEASPREGGVDWNLAKLLAKLDKTRTLVPTRIADRLRSLPEDSTTEILYRWAHFQCLYPEGSPGWRIIALPVLERARKASKDDAQSLRAILRGGRMFSFSGTPGAVMPQYADEVRRLKQLVSHETDPLFIPFWRESVEQAERDLEQERNRVARKESFELGRLPIALVRIAEAQDGFLSTRQLHEYLSPAAIREAVALAHVDETRAGVFRLATWNGSTHDEEWIALLSAGSDAVLSHETALASYGISDVLPNRIHVTVPTPRSVDSGSLELDLHVARLGEHDIDATARPLRTTLVRTLADCSTDGIDPKTVSQAIERACDTGLLDRRQAKRLANGLFPKRRSA